MARLFGKPGKAGKAVRPEQVDAGNGGRTTPGNALPGPAIIYGRQPIAVGLAVRLFAGSSLTSPSVRGRFRAGNEGDAVHRGVDGGAPDLGALQTFRGLVGRPMSARLGAQGGPSSQPGYPSTGSGSSVLQSLANLSRPDVQRYGGLR